MRKTVLILVGILVMATSMFAASPKIGDYVDTVDWNDKVEVKVYYAGGGKAKPEFALAFFNKETGKAFGKVEVTIILNSLPNLLNMSQFSDDIGIYDKTPNDALLMKKLGTNYYINFWTSDNGNKFLTLIGTMGKKDVCMTHFLYLE